MGDPARMGIEKEDGKAPAATRGCTAIQRRTRITMTRAVSDAEGDPDLVRDQGNGTTTIADPRCGMPSRTGGTARRQTMRGS